MREKKTLVKTITITTKIKYSDLFISHEKANKNISPNQFKLVQMDSSIVTNRSKENSNEKKRKIFNGIFMNPEQWCCFSFFSSCLFTVIVVIFFVVLIGF